jgi:ceramide glucosyltransferase
MALFLMMVLERVLVLLLVGSWVCSVLIAVAARLFLRATEPAVEEFPPVSVLKPLCGWDDRLEDNLRSFFMLDYPDYEVLFAVHRKDDPAAALVRKVQRQFPRGPKVQLVETGEPTIPNAKAHSLRHLVTRAKHNILVMADSDVHVPPGLLRSIVAEFCGPQVGIVTCPYRGVPGQKLWSQLEAIGMNTEFLAGVLMARMFGGMDFALGPTLAAKREVIEALGGFSELGDYLAEDFVIGSRASELGYKVVLSRCIVEHRIGSQCLAVNVRHRLRWARSTRCSRPLGYWGQIFTNPLPLALLLWIAVPKSWPLLVFTAAVRGMAAWATSICILDDTLTKRRWWLIPLQDVISLFVWIFGFFGNTVEWRGRRYSIFKDGRLCFLDNADAMREQAWPSLGAPPSAFRQSDIRPGEEILRP